MKYKNLPEMKSKLLDIRSRLLGGIEKTIKTSQDEEFTQLVPDTTDDASRSFSRQMLLNLGEQDRERLIQVEEALYQMENGGIRHLQIVRGTHSRGPADNSPICPALCFLPEYH